MVKRKAMQGGIGRRWPSRRKSSRCDRAQRVMGTIISSYTLTSCRHRQKGAEQQEPHLGGSEGLRRQCGCALGDLSRIYGVLKPWTVCARAPGLSRTLNARALQFGCPRQSRDVTDHNRVPNSGHLHVDRVCCACGWPPGSSLVYRRFAVRFYVVLPRG